MFKFCLLGLLLSASSVQAMEDRSLFTWDDHASGTSLHVSFQGNDKRGEPWTLLETQQKHTSFYQDLFSDSEVMKTMSAGKAISRDTTATYVNNWVEKFAQGLPWGRMTMEQDLQPIGCAQVARKEGQHGVGEFAFALAPSTQGRGIGKGALSFIVETWAPAVRKIGLSQDSKAPFTAIEKFQCCGDEALKLLYATVLPSNGASIACFDSVGFSRSQPANKMPQLSIENWEATQHEPLDDYIVNQYFSPTSSHQLPADVLYEMVDEKSNPRTVSLVSEYEKPRYHFEREVK